MRTVRLTSCPNAVEAYMIKQALEAEGIGCALHNENMSNIFGGLGAAFSEIDLLVYEDTLDRAREIMQRVLHSESETESDVAVSPESTEG